MLWRRLSIVTRRRVAGAGFWVESSVEWVVRAGIVEGCKEVPEGISRV